MAGPAVPLNAPVPAAHKANRLPIVMGGITGVIVVGLGIAAWLVKTRQPNTEAMAKANPPASVDTSSDQTAELDDLWKGVPAVKASANPSTTPATTQAAITTPGATGTGQPPTGQPTTGQQQPLAAIEGIPRTPAEPGMSGYPAYVPAPPTPVKDEETLARESPLIRTAAGATPSSPNVAPAVAPYMMPAPTGNGADKLQVAGNLATEYERQNLTAAKKAFSGAGDKGEPIFADQPTAPVPYAIRAGWNIPAILAQNEVSDLPGSLRARVRENVYDTDTGCYLLIPQNSMLFGQYNSNVSYGQNRVQVKWTRLSRPGDGPTILLDQMGGEAADGSAGMVGHVNNHYKRLIGFALLSSAFAAGIQVAQNHGTQSTLAYPSSGQVAGAAVGQQLGAFGERITEKNMNIPPSISAPAGTRFDVKVDRDIIFRAPYQERSCR